MVVEELVEAARMEAAAAGRKLALVYQIFCDTGEFAAVEVAFALTLSRFAAEDIVRLAAELGGRQPEVLAALSNGDITVPKARAFAEILAVLDVETAWQVASLVLPRARERTVGQIRDMLRRKAIAADPAYTRARRERAASMRAVHVTANNDGTTGLSAFGLDSARTAAAMNRITALARARRYAGDMQRMEQLRADVFLELLEGQHTETGRGTINLTVSLETLARFNDDPATLAGYGPIAADIARQWADAHPGYQWNYAIHTNGTLAQTGTTRARPTTPAHRPQSPSPTQADQTHSTQPAPDGEPPADRGPGRQPAPDGKPPADRVPRQRPVPDVAPANHAPQQPTGPSSSDGGRPEHERNTKSVNAGTAEANSSTAATGLADELVRAPVQNPRDRFASAAMTRWIRLRDKTCRAPGCRMPAVQCDIDHQDRHADGGLTTHDNLCLLCRYHHRAKDEGGFTLIQTRPGHFIWISPLGRIYQIEPEPT